MAQTGLRYRRAKRALRSQPPLVQGLSLAIAGVLVAGLLTALVVSGSSSSSVTPSATRVSIGAGRTRAGSPGVSSSATASAVGSGSGGGAIPSQGALSSSGPLSSGTGTATSPSATSGTRTPINAAVAHSLCGDNGYNGPSGPLTASDQGVTADSIKVAFPYFDPTASFAMTGTQNQKPENQPDFIQAYVDCVNAAGGIMGRKIVPLIQVFNPLDDNLMHALCIKWATEDKVFAVVDSAAWIDQHQLCLTQDYHIPLVSGWTSVTEFAKDAHPYLWWTEPTSDESIDNLVLWAKERGQLTTKAKIGVVTTDRPVDQLALKNHLLPALSAAGFKPTDVETFTYDRSQAEAQATVAVEKLQQAGVNVLLPLLTFDSFAFYLQAAQNQSFVPHMLLSDYEEEVVTAQALLGDRYPKQLNGAVAETYDRLGEGDQDANYPAKYDASEQRCVNIWKTEHPGTIITKGGENMRWCDSITAFVDGARKAGANLTRLSWAAGMGNIGTFGAGMTPQLTYSSQKWWGPDLMKAVVIKTSGCVYPYTTPGSNTCVYQTEPYGPIRHF